MTTANIEKLIRDVLGSKATPEAKIPMGNETAQLLVLHMQNIPELSFSVTYHAHSPGDDEEAEELAIHIYNRKNGLDGLEAWSFRYHGFQEGRRFDTWPKLASFLSGCILENVRYN